MPAGCDTLCLEREGGSGQHSHFPLALNALALWMVEKVRKRAKSSLLLVVVRLLSHTHVHPIMVYHRVLNSLLSYTVGLCCLSILYIPISIC